MSSGLQTYIWNNNIKSLILLATYPFILLGIVWGSALIIGSNASLNAVNIDNGIDFAHNFIFQYWPLIIAITALWFMISYFLNASMIANMAHAKPVTRTQEPELYNLLENLCIAEGMAMPKFNIIGTHALNAFASGINNKTYTITVTRGLLNRLSKDELEGVIAHELTHIKNKDVRLMMITIIFTGMIGFAAQILWSHLRYRIYIPNRLNKKSGGILALLLITAILWIGYLATIFMRFALSRRREYMADSGAVMMTKNPDALMRALIRISGREQISGAPADISFMCFENEKPFMGLFATHPPIEKRIQALSAMTNTPVPHITTPVADQTMPTQQKNPWLSRTRPFRQKKNPWTDGSI